ncbi:MAG: hypothetical protein K6F30_02545 [Lachnospiraceae bacterium]|nr:hypothetical protein [Lachnospiraceae bacterium]
MLLSKLHEAKHHINVKVDMFSLFYLRFVNKNAGIDEHFWTNIGKTGKKIAWFGYAFEQVCLNHIPQIKAKLGISGILSNSYAWSRKAFTDSDGNEWEGGQNGNVQSIGKNKERFKMHICSLTTKK